MAIGPLKTICLAAAFAMSAAGTAHAVPYVWTDVYDPADVYLNAPSEYSFTHDITDGANGFRSGIDMIAGASLTVWLYDDALFGDLPWLGDSQEYVTFNFDDSGWSAEQSVDSILWLPDLFNFSVASLVSDGFLDVVVKAVSGDFYFDRSVLFVYGDRADAIDVPEPGTLALFGLGLLGLGLAARTRRRTVQ